MAKLKKMLGRLEDPSIQALMDLIPTQSKETLAHWAIQWVQDHCLPIWTAEFSDDDRPARALEAGVAYYSTGRRTPAIREALAGVTAAAREADSAGLHPAATAAARAIATAAAVFQTPTNALGFTFYAAAAYAYSSAGLGQQQADYDALASGELRQMYLSLQQTAVENEPDPVKIYWNC